MIAYRGTNNIIDWLRNISFSQVPFYHSVPEFDGFYAHRGFLRQFESVREKTDKVVEEAISNQKDLLITGHSLGGALGILATAFYNEKHRGRVKFIGFGTPRVCNIKFEEYMEGQFPGNKLVRVKYGRDPVTDAPLKGFFIRYRHPGLEY